MSIQSGVQSGRKAAVELVKLSEDGYECQSSAHAPLNLCCPYSQ